MLKETDRLANNLAIDLIAQVGNRGVARVLNLRHAEVLGDALGDEQHNERQTENGPNVVNARRKEFMSYICGNFA